MATNESKVDVPLKWLDFIWSLEQIRHKKRFVSDNDRDWFKLNPIEIVFLGCQSIVDQKTTVQKLSNVVISMEYITPFIVKKPRILKWLMSLLLQQLTTVSMSSFMNQRIQKYLIEIVDISKSNSRFWYWSYAFLVEYIDKEPKVKDAISSVEGRIMLQNVSDAITLAGLDSKIIVLTHVHESLFMLKLRMLIDEYSVELVERIWKKFHIESILSTLTKTSIDVNATLNQFCLLLGVIISVCQDEDLTEKTTDFRTESNIQSIKSYKSSNKTKSSNADKEADVFESSSISQVDKSITSGNVKNTSPVAKIFYDLLECFMNCRDQFKEPTEIPFYVITYVWVELSQCSDNQIEALMLDINIHNLLQIFISYSEKAPNISSEILVTSLLEFITSGVEMEVQKSTLLAVHLPNLLSLGFEIGDGETRTLLLEYGSLAFRSKKQKELISSSLWFIKDMMKLFPTKKEKRKQNEFIKRRLQSVQAVSQIMEELIDLVVHSVSSNSVDQDLKLPLDVALSKENDLLEQEVSSHGSCEKETLESENEDIADEYTQRLRILNYALQLTCCMIKSDGNVSFIFASVIPKLFQFTQYPDIPVTIPSSFFPNFTSKTTYLPWKIPKENLAERVLKLCIDCYEKQKSSAFQICGLMLPKLVRSLDLTKLEDSMKMNVLEEFLTHCQKTLSVSNNGIEMLSSHGLDLMSLLMPVTDNGSDVRKFIHQMFTSIEKLSHHSSSIFLLKTSCDFFMTNVQSKEYENVKDLFTFLTKKCNRNDIRNIFLLSRPWFLPGRFDVIRCHILGYPKGILKSRQLEAITEILTSLVQLEEKNSKSISNEYVRTDCVTSIGDYFTQPILNELQDAIIDQSFTVDKQEDMRDKISRLYLYFILFHDKMLKVVEGLHETGCKSFNMEENIPDDVLFNRRFMVLLQTCAKRIEAMQTPRYQSLKTLLTNILVQFLIEFEKEASAKCSTEPILTDEKDLQVKSDLEFKLTQRISHFNLSLMQKSWNAEKKTNLLSHKYHPDLWSDTIEISIETKGILNLEENLRQTLLSCFNEYTDILLQLGILHVRVDGNQVKTEDIFSDEFTLIELKGRRAIVVKTIDKIAVSQKQTRILEKKSALLLQEESIEKKIETMAKQSLKKKSFKGKLNISFFDCARCCGSQIVGCYSPISGEHCERPLEIGYRVDSGFASIYNEDGVEIENAEFLFTDQGMYMYRAYSSGHPYDTSEIWLELIVEILEKKQFVPAIILPKHYPNRSTWEAIRRWVSPDLVGTIVTCDFDCSSEWRTYYDSRPDCVGYGKDIILTKGFRNKERKTSFSYQRQVSLNNNKDLASMMFEFMMEKMLQDEQLKSFRFIGKFMLMFLNDFIETGYASPKIIYDNFNYARWMKNRKGTVVLSKDEIVNIVVTFILCQVEVFIESLNITLLLTSHTRQVLQLRLFLHKNNRSTKPLQCSKGAFDKIELLLTSRLHLIPINEFDESFQEELMHWIFDNEDRVWRYRGGRDGHETLNQYLGFLKPKLKDFRCFPGIVVTVQKHDADNLHNLRVKDVVAYSVGEYVNEDDDEEEEEEEEKISQDVTSSKKENQQAKNKNCSCYEVVTAWVDPRYRGLQLSTSIYLKTFKLVEADTVMFDILQNNLTKILKSSTALRLMDKLGASKLVIKSRGLSYNVTTETGNEQFEKLLVFRKPTVFGVALVDWFRKNGFYLVIFVILLLISIIFQIMFT